ncbi:hypothetical protein OG417_31505 [Actinoallomurus sp. NBC_01490]|jgi:hypothetical protein|uniref:hypothetical protein n=1 Tax=Actinoallomurus sp. NBC_01490 TaxID=2903557 RepID=UPI002E36AE45|nr:hypothetical protein [Actinoallomurus sp. NBC_01490]
MRNCTAKILIALTALVTIMAGAPPASADQTWTVGPATDGAEIDFEGTASGVTLTDNHTGAFYTCQRPWVAGETFAGSGQPGTGIAEIEAMGAGVCNGPAGMTFSITTTDFPWQFNAETFSDGVTTGTISGMSLHFSGPFCQADFDGPGGAGSGTGEVVGTYDNSAHQLVISGGNLTISNVYSCLGLLQNGDSITLNGAYTLSPEITITSP